MQTDRAEIRDDVGSRALENVPVPIGRNYQNLFITLPGVSPPTNANSFTANAQRGLTFVVNGGLAGYNSIRVDGTGTFDMTANNEAQYTPALEAIENVSISGNSFDAEQSAGGGAINITVKSGTNAVHGVLFEDHTDQHIEAYPWNAVRNTSTGAPVGKPVYINNQYGGAIGGPIKKDKWFYFLSYEGTGLVANGPFSAEVPTAVMRTGNLSGAGGIADTAPIYNPFTGTPGSGLNRVPFAGNIIPQTMISPNAQALLNYSAANGNLWSLPNQPGTGSLGLANNLNTNGETYWSATRRTSRPIGTPPRNSARLSVSVGATTTGPRLPSLAFWAGLACPRPIPPRDTEAPASTAELCPRRTLSAPA